MKNSSQVFSEAVKNISMKVLREWAKASKFMFNNISYNNDSGFAAAVPYIQQYALGNNLQRLSVHWLDVTIIVLAGTYIQSTPVSPEYQDTVLLFRQSESAFLNLLLYCTYEKSLNHAREK